MTFRHRAGVSPYTSPFGFAETCVFAKQSPGPFHCGLHKQAPLLPKLRGQYAEFLNNPSPVGLRILSSSTCVGLRYGRPRYTSHLFSPLCHPELPTIISVLPGQPTPEPELHIVSVCLNLQRPWNINHVCIDYAFRPRLSSRLTRGGRTYPRKP